MTTFTPDLSLPIPGDFDSSFTQGTGVIDTVGNRIHSTTTSTDPESSALVTKDVFGAGGANDISLRFSLQEVLGEAMPANLFGAMRVYDTGANIVMDLAFQIGREPFLTDIIAGGSFASSLLPAIDTSLHRFLVCLNHTTGDYSAQMDSSVISGNTGIGGPFRYVSFGSVFDHAGPLEHFNHELFTGAITVQDGACPPFNTGRCAGASRGSCSRGGCSAGGGSHCGG